METCCLVEEVIFLLVVGGMSREEDRTPDGDLSMSGDADVHGIYFITVDFTNASAMVIEYLDREDFCHYGFIWLIDLPRVIFGAVFVKELERSEHIWSRGEETLLRELFINRHLA